MFTVLIVDDEHPARRKLRRLLEGEADVSTIYEARDGETALEVVRKEHPDVLFLDVQMPGLDGLKLIDALPEQDAPLIVFVTAYDEYAVNAFAVRAIDYLLKPFDRERFAVTLDRVRQTLVQEEQRVELERLRGALVALRSEQSEPASERILVEDGSRTVLLPCDEIDHLESNRNYVVVSSGARQFRLRSTLKELEGRLDAKQFARLNRSTIVRVDTIAELRPAGHGDYDVLLDSGRTVRMSRRYRSRLTRFEI